MEPSSLARDATLNFDDSPALRHRVREAASRLKGVLVGAAFLQLLLQASCAPLLAVACDEPIVSLGPVHTFLYYVFVPAMASVLLLSGMAVLIGVVRGWLPAAWLLALGVIVASAACLAAGRAAYRAEPWFWWSPS